MKAGAGQARYGFVSPACIACAGCLLGNQRLNLIARPRTIKQDGTPLLSVSHSSDHYPLSRFRAALFRNTMRRELSNPIVPDCTN